ncbi:EAL domain-containing protein [Herbaspirillum sp. RTI4]|uniref:EAL and HDOD domain-containing protein n=1 Tax=Herbaspirillum sp. RTI4 TaxID=3048640 RepID=UPI002AB4E733|nr:EAL domain-containing protein [Herbaspirillum sp. RTI4]MDY7578402.1 EAL domain-containing protein [Herbaspirillum sp. RTI4]MEA9983057.1 EAL domain-containing protein [Herbaspirillum sp. RTI4]
MLEPTSELLMTDKNPKDFFLARQPIVTRSQALMGYELLFRNAATGGAVISDDMSATAAVIAHAAELGLNNVIGNLYGFINVDAAVLMSDFIHFLPRDKIVLEILETVQVTPTLVKRVKQLAQAGYRFALDDVVAESKDIEQILPWVEIIKIDILAVSPGKLLELCIYFTKAKKKLLAEKVETRAQFDECLAFGFDYFQGYYFAKPFILQGKKLESSSLIIMHILTLVVRNVDNAEIVRFIKKDMALSLTLLRLVNTPVYGLKKHIDSLGHALIMLGRLHLKRWLQILLFASTDQGKIHQLSPLLILAATRGKLLELIAEKRYPAHATMSETAFTVGILSLIDVLFGMPMVSLLKEISVSDEIRAALMDRSGFLGAILELAEYVEGDGADQSKFKDLLSQSGLSTEEFYEIEKAAFAWSNDIVSKTGLSPDS